MAEAIPPTLQVLWQQLALNQQGTPVSSNTTFPTKQRPPPYKPPPTLPPPPPQNRGSFVLCCWPPPPPPAPWLGQSHRTLYQHTDEEEGRPRPGPGRIPDPGHAEREGPPACTPAHQRQQPPAPLSTARQSSQHSAFADSPPRAGQARPPGARPPRFDSTRSATRATRQIPPKAEPTVMRLNGRD